MTLVVEAPEKVLSEAHREYLMVDRALMPSTIEKHGLYSVGELIAIPLQGGLVKLYNRNGLPKMRWERELDAGECPPPFPSWEGLRRADLIVEGEFDAMLAEQELGIPVASGTTGSQGWRQEWTDALTGQTKTILYDNDESGRKGGNALAQKLRQGGVNASVAYWPPEKPKGYDITEHFRLGGSVDELKDVLLHAKEYLPPGIAKSMHEFITVDAGQRKMLVEGIWPEGALGWVAGPPKSFKSWLTLELGMAIASGEAFLGIYRVPFPQRVLLIQAESAYRAFQARVKDAMRRYGRSDWMFLISNVPFDLMNPKDQEALEGEIDRVRPALTILDPLASFFTGDENSAQETGKVVRFIRELRDKYGTGFAIVHHSNKGSGHVASQRGGLRMRGSSTLYAAAEVMISVERTDNEAENTSKVRVELKEEEAPQPFLVQLDPATRLLNVSDRAQRPAPTRAYWQQTEIPLVEGLDSLVKKP